MTLCFSRHMYAEIVTNQKVETWLACHRRAFEYFNGVPAKTDHRQPQVRHHPGLLPGSGSTTFLRGAGRRIRLFDLSLSARPIPKRRARVEAGVKYVKNRFVPLRQFRSLTDANGQLKQWVMETAGNRIHGTTQPKAADLVCRSGKTSAAPPSRCAGGDRRLDPAQAARQLPCAFEKAYLLGALSAGSSAAVAQGHRHHRQDLSRPGTGGRSSPAAKPGARSTVDEHLPPEAIAYKMQDPQWCLRQAEAIGSDCHRLIQAALQRPGPGQPARRPGGHRPREKVRRRCVWRAPAAGLFFDNPRYKTVKSILEKGLDQSPLPNRLTRLPLSSVYTDTAVSSGRRPSCSSVGKGGVHEPHARD